MLRNSYLKFQKPLRSKLFKDFTLIMAHRYVNEYVNLYSVSVLEKCRIGKRQSVMERTSRIWLPGIRKALS